MLWNRICFAPDGSGGGSGDAGGSGSAERGTQSALDHVGQEFSGQETQQNPGNPAQQTQTQSPTRQYTRPDYLPEAFFDPNKGEVRVAELAKAFNDTKKALHAKSGIPDPSDDNPYGYDIRFMTGRGKEGDKDFVKGLGYSREQIDSDPKLKQDLVDYFKEAREAGISQKGAEWQLRKFHQWKAEYDRMMGYDIDGKAEAGKFVKTMQGEYGNDAKNVIVATKNLLERAMRGEIPEIPSDVAWALNLTGDGLAYAARTYITNKLGPTPIQGNTAAAGRTLKDIDTEIAKLQNDPRRKLPHGNPERGLLEDQLNDLFKEKTTLGGGVRERRANKRVGQIRPEAQGWTDQAQANEQYRRVKINVGR